MKQIIKLNLLEQSKVIEVMEEYSFRFKGMNKARFDVVTEKVKANVTAFDSEEMIYIVEALRSYSKILYLHREYEECHKLRKLADRVEKLRINHQAMHNPLNNLMVMA